MTVRVFCVVTLAFLLAPAVSGDEKLKGVACRSVHLGYPAAEGSAFYNELTVEKSADGTYFMACGFSKGYFGIQELADGKKVVIFSVWDPTAGDDPKKVKEDQRVKVLHKGEGVRVGRFGGEGTGGQSFFDLRLEGRHTYRFFVTAKVDGQRTEYAAYFWLPEKKEWKHLVTFSTITKGQALRGLLLVRRGLPPQQGIDEEGAAGERSAAGGSRRWTGMGGADAGTFHGGQQPGDERRRRRRGGRFYLATGGDMKNAGTAAEQDDGPPARRRAAGEVKKERWNADQRPLSCLIRVIRVIRVRWSSRLRDRTAPPAAPRRRPPPAAGSPPPSAPSPAPATAPAPPRRRPAIPDPADSRCAAQARSRCRRRRMTVTRRRRLGGHARRRTQQRVEVVPLEQRRRLPAGAARGRSPRPDLRPAPAPGGGTWGS